MILTNEMKELEISKKWKSIGLESDGVIIQNEPKPFLTEKEKLFLPITKESPEWKDIRFKNASSPIHINMFEPPRNTSIDFKLKLIEKQCSGKWLNNSKCMRINLNGIVTKFCTERHFKKKFLVIKSVITDTSQERINISKNIKIFENYVQKKSTILKGIYYENVIDEMLLTNLLQKKYKQDKTTNYYKIMKS